MFSRRSLLAAASLPILGSKYSVAQTPFKISNKNISAARPIPIGGLYWDGFPDNNAYTAAIIKHTTEIVDGNKMRLDDLQKTPGQPYNFTELDRIVAFTSGLNRRIRGSHLIWGGTEPKWLKSVTSSIEMERVMQTYIRTVMTRYPGKFYNFIVLNEPLEDEIITPLDMRPSSYQRVLGNKHVEMAFKIAAESDPKADLMLNEYGIEFNTPKAKVKREGLKRMIFNLLEKGVKIDAVGLQSHLFGTWEIDKDGLSRFIEEMVKAKVKVHITEIDVFDHEIQGSFADRDLAVARLAYTYLDTIFQVSRPESITPWGITDKHFWGNMWFKRKDGNKLRGLPLDEFYQPKPLMNVINHFCKGEPLTL